MRIPARIGFYLNPSKPETYINISAILNAIITFLITAAVVYFVFVAPMKKFMDIAAARAAAKKQPIKADPTEVELLVEIRDLLRAGNTIAADSLPAGTGRVARAPSVALEPGARRGAGQLGLSRGAAAVVAVPLIAIGAGPGPTRHRVRPA